MLGAMNLENDKAGYLIHTFIIKICQGQIWGVLWVLKHPHPSAKTIYKYQYLAGQPALAPSLKPRNLDLAYIWLQNLVVGRVCGNNVGVVSLKWAWPKFFMSTLCVIIYLSTPLSWGPGSAPVCPLRVFPYVRTGKPYICNVLRPHVMWKTGNTCHACAYYINDLYSKEHCRLYACILWPYYAYSYT